MKPTFAGTRDWAHYPRLNLDALSRTLPDMPGLTGSFKYEGGLDIRSWLESYEFIVLTGDVSITEQQLDALGHGTLLVIDGNLAIDGCPKNIFFVGGDLYCNEVDLYALTPSHRIIVGGRIVSDCADVFAEDDAVMCQADVARLDTRFLFSWFHEIDNIALSREAVIMIMGQEDYCTAISKSNPVFYWHEGMHVLNSACINFVTSDDSSEIPWNLEQVAQMLQRGESVYKDGYDIASYPWQKAADCALASREFQWAYLLYRQSAALSPSYFLAWYGMGEALYQVCAFEQALSAFTRAATFFPHSQIHMVNDALNSAASCALRTGQVDLAFELAHRSVMHNFFENRADWPRGCAAAYRLRAEAFMLQGKNEAALADLTRALTINPRHWVAMWLKGCLLFRAGDHAGADFQYKSASAWREGMPAYDEQSDTNFLSGAPVMVDWERIGVDAVVLPEA